MKCAAWFCILFFGACTAFATSVKVKKGKNENEIQFFHPCAFETMSGKKIFGAIVGEDDSSLMVLSRWKSAGEKDSVRLLKSDIVKLVKGGMCANTRVGFFAFAIVVPVLAVPLIPVALIAGGLEAAGSLALAALAFGAAAVLESAILNRSDNSYPCSIFYTFGDGWAFSNPVPTP